MRPRWLPPDAYGVIHGALLIAALVAVGLAGYALYLIAEWMMR